MGTVSRRMTLSIGLSALLATTAGCENYFPLLLFDTGRAAGDGGVVAGDGFGGGSGGAFTASLLQARTFTEGTSVTTVTYAVDDLTRVALGVDFNGDGKIDPVIGYGDTQAVVQILYSQGAAGSVNYASLTLDSKRDMQDLNDVAVADVDNDGRLDILAAAKAAVWYLHHPSDAPTTDLAAWGNQNPDDPLRERIDASFSEITDSELQALISQALGPGVNLDDYFVTIEQLYTNVEAADFDNDGDFDVAASRSFEIALTPKPDLPVEPLSIVDGDVLIFVNPGNASTGVGWSLVSVGAHERQTRLDRDGAYGLLAYDVDGDGDLDLVSAARTDNNAQVAWFANPGALDPDARWQQYRIGSVRDARSIDVADLTGDGNPDVIATGGEQMQLLLFEQPADGPARTYDWDTYAIVTFENYEPRDARAIDIDNDGRREIVLVGTEGAVRYFEPSGDPRDTWEGTAIVTFDPPGTVGVFGFGDLDGDGDLDLVTVVDADDETDDRLAWIRND